MRLLFACLLVCLLLAGCGRFGFGDGDDAAAPLTALELEPAAFSTTSTEFVAVPGATLTVPASPGTSWLVLVSATLASTNIAEVCVEARYLVDDVERGLGGTQGLGAGPWQHFYMLAGGEAAQTISVQLRDASAGTATIDQLRVVAIPLPPAADARYASRDDVTIVTGLTMTDIATFSLGAMAGDHVVLVGVNSTDAPGASDTYIEWLGPGGEVLLERSQNPREPWQALLMVRVLPLTAADGTFTLRAAVGSMEDANQLRYIRAFAMRADAFVSVQQQLTRTPIVTQSATVMIANQLAPAGDGAARYLYLASSWSEEDCANVAPALRRLHFTIDAEDRVIEHATDNCAFQLTYGMFDLLPARPASLATGISSANGQNVVLGDSQLVLLGLP